MIDRPQITEEQVDQAIDVVRFAIKRRLAQKGWGAFVSRHEILGILEEERHEMIEAVHHETQERLSEELIDIAVGCVFGVASIKAGVLQW